MSTIKVEAVCEPAVLGEGPHWDHEVQMLYYVDIPSSTVHRYVPATNKHTKVKVGGGTVSLIIPVSGKKDQFLISQGRDLCMMTWDGESNTPSKVEPFLTVDHEKPKNRVNDGKFDSSGRLWAGTVGPEVVSGKFAEKEGCMFSMNDDRKTITVHATELTIANGLVWSADNKIMYYIDSSTKKVEGFDFDIKQGKVSNRRVIFDFEKNNVEGLADGMTIDSDGNLWVACFYGSHVLNIDPSSGKLLSRLPIPARNVTSVAFGGADLDELYVTTASIKMTEDQKVQYPNAGSLFKVTGLTGANGSKVKGVPANLMKM